MKTPAIIASLTVVGSIAYAAGQGGAGKQPPMMPSGSQAHSMQEEMPQTRSQMTGGCTEGATLNWFTVVHDASAADDCVGEGFSFWSERLLRLKEDVNQDGQPDGFFSGFGFQPGSDPNQPIFTRVVFQMKNSSNPVLQQTLLRANVIIQFLGTTNWNYIFPMGLVDMDDDGDLDLLVQVEIGPQPHSLCVENTGFQHTTHLTGDLDGDGKVNGSDLGTLLSNWQN